MDYINFHISDFTNLAPLSVTGLVVAVFCGFIIGLDRQISGKAAGIRTSILICMGAYAYVVLSTALSGKDSTDDTRVLGQVITGIGFLGAGVMLARKNMVIGVTSAAVIWILAAIGCFVGFGKYGPAIILSIISIITLQGINFLERKVKRFRKGLHNDPEYDDD